MFLVVLALNSQGLMLARQATVLSHSASPFYIGYFSGAHFMLSLEQDPPICGFLFG
jgi:hypothetical protein